MGKLLRKESRPEATVRLEKGFEECANITLLETARTPRVNLGILPCVRITKTLSGCIVSRRNDRRRVVQECITSGLCCVVHNVAPKLKATRKCTQLLGSMRCFQFMKCVCVFTPHEAGCDSADQSSRVESGSKIGGQVSRREIKTRAMRPRRSVETGHKYL